MMMLFPREKRLLFLSSTIIILICISGNVLSLVPSIVTLPSYGTIKAHARATFTYYIFKNSTSTYRVNSAGYVDDYDSDPAVVINGALWECSAAGGGSIYVVPNTYLTGTPLGSTTLYNTDFSNVYLELGNGTIIRRTSGGKEADYMFYMLNYGSGTTNFTLTSNGTAYFDAQNYANGASMLRNFNCTLSNITFEHLNGQGITYSRSRYLNIENLTVFSYDEGYEGGSMLTLSDVQFSTLKHIVLDGNNQAKSRIGFYMGDWDDGPGWDGSYFNTIEDMWVRNVRRDGIYLNSGAAGWHVYNNTFTNCTLENNWGGPYDAIKLRPAQNNTFTNIVIRNFTNAVTTGTSYDTSETPGDCTGNSVTATIYGSTVASLILTTDGNGQSVDHNFFNLSIIGGKGTWLSSGTNSMIHDNTVYLNFTNTGGLYFESGYIQNNTFVASFLDCGTDGYADIRFYGDPSIAYNRIYILAESGNPHGQLEGSLGTNQIINGPP